jgi:transcriptional regulator GlxA family with amidase domain
MGAQAGLTPLGQLHQQRIIRAQDLLERTEASVEEIAARCGMGTATTLRRTSAELSVPARRPTAPPSAAESSRQELHPPERRSRTTR